MRASPEDLTRVSKCPRRAFLYRPKKIIKSKKEDAVFRTIQKGYLYLTEHRFHADWPTILKHIDKIWYKDINILDDVAFISAKKQLEPLLQSVLRWHSNIYMRTNNIGYVGLHLEQIVGDHTLFNDLDLVIIDEHPFIVDVSFQERTPREMRLDYNIRINLWLLARCAGLDRVGYRHIQIKEQGGLSVENYSMGKKQLDRTDSIINQLLHILNEQMDYPTFNSCEECESSGRCVI